MRDSRFRNGTSILAGLLLLMGAFDSVQSDENARQGDENRYGLKAHHVTALVTDIERATTWYRDVLGFKVIGHGSRLDGVMKYADLRIEGFGISLVEVQKPALEVKPGDLIRPAWVHIVFSVADPDRTFHALKDRGARVSTREAVSNAPVKSFLLYDSEGDEIEIVAETSD